MHILLAFLVAFAAHAEGVDCSRPAGSLPNPKAVAGSLSSEIPLQHFIFIMQENHSFDEYLGRLNVAGYQNEVDGVTPEMFNYDRNGHKVHAYHEHNLCLQDIGHGWNAMHGAWNYGRNDQFVALNGTRSISFYDTTDLHYYYTLANVFSVADRYFASVLSQTFPNRFFFLTGTAFGHIRNDEPKGKDQFSQKTIFDVLDKYGVTWKYYASSPKENYLMLFQKLYRRDIKKMATLADYENDLKNGTLPQVAIVESSEDNGEDEHPASNVQKGQAWVAARVEAFMNSKYWKTSALFLSYDEAGGFFDHVAPPEACVPDNYPPALQNGDMAGAYDRYGFRVPFFVVSAFSKRHHVSHVTYDHTSLLKLLELKYNLPALTKRDANANAPLDMFDFANPNFELPSLPEATVDPDRAARCVQTKKLK